MSRLMSLRVLLAVALTALIAGCGSGGGSNDDGGGTTPSSSDWDTMIWDQDNWA